jgi:hypothetical protein
MKIVCHVCGASFQALDEKIRGRVVKYNCRKCHAVLTVDGTVLPSASAPPPAPVEEALGPMSLDASLGLSGLVAVPSDQVATTKVAPRTPASSKEMNWDEEPTALREPPPVAANPAPFTFPIFGGTVGAAKRAPRPNPDRNKTQPGLGASFDPVPAPVPATPLPVRPPREASIELSAELIPPSGDVVDERLIEDAPPSSDPPPIAEPTGKTPEPTEKIAEEDEEPPVSLVPDSTEDAPPSSGLPLSVLGGLPKPAPEASSRVNLDDLLSLGNDPAAPPALNPAALGWDLGASAGPLWQTPEPEPVAPVTPDVLPPPPPRREARSDPDAVLSSLPPGPPPFEAPRVGSIAPATAVTEAPSGSPKRSPVLFFVGGLVATVVVFFLFRSTLLPAAPVAPAMPPAATATPTVEPATTAELATTMPEPPATASATPEPAPSTTAESTAKAEPTLMAKAEPTLMAKAEPTLMAKAEPTLMAKAESTPTAKAEPVAKAEPTSTAKAEPTSTATAKVEPPAKAESTTALVMPAAPAVPTVALPASGSEEFNKDAARGALASAAGAAAGCAKEDGPKGVARVQVTFSTSGRVTQAQIAGPPFAGTAVGGCIAAAFRRASVPPFSGSPVTVTKTVSIQ